MGFPPPADLLIHEDVKALFKLAGVTWQWQADWLSFRVLLHDQQYYADMLVEPDQLQDLALAQHLVRLMVTNLERVRAGEIHPG